MKKQLGLDISYWQTEIDFNKMKSNDVKFVFVRATYGDWSDPNFKDNYANAKKAGLIRGAYHFHRFDSNDKSQLDRFIGMLNNDIGEINPVLDFERAGSIDEYSKDEILQRLQWSMEYIEKNLRKPIFYTNPDLLNYLKPIPEWLLSHDLWVAHYTSGDRPSIGGFTKWTFWQFTDRLVSGSDYGVSSKQVDGDYFNGTEEELRIYAGITEPIPASSEIEERLIKLENWARKLNYTG